MSPNASHSLKFLILCSESATARELESRLRRTVKRPCSVMHAASPAEALGSFGGIPFDRVWMDLDGEPDLALEVTAELRRRGQAVVGLYNPLAASRGESELLRRAVRAGVSDFLSLPASEKEIAAVVNGGGGAADVEPSRAPVEGRTVTFLSAKGGVGVTTLAVAVAWAADVEGDGELLLVDAVPRFGTCADVAGTAADHDLADLARDLGDPVALPAYLAPVPGAGFRLLAGPRDPVAAESLSPADLSRVLIELGRRFPQTVVDGGSRFDGLTLAALDLADRVVLVTDALRPSLVGARRLLELLDELGVAPERIRTALNRYSRADGHVAPSRVEELLGRGVDHVIPEDPQVVSAASRGELPPVDRPRSDFAREVRDLARSCFEVQAGAREAVEVLR